MAQGDFTKEEAAECASSLRRIFKELPLSSQKALGEKYDRIAEFLRQTANATLYETSESTSGEWSLSVDAQERVEQLVEDQRQLLVRFCDWYRMRVLVLEPDGNDVDEFLTLQSKRERPPFA